MVDVVAFVVQKADVELLSTEIESSVQHVGGLLGARFSVNTSIVSPRRHFFMAVQSGLAQSGGRHEEEEWYRHRPEKAADI
jgi:hypothetical protein